MIDPTATLEELYGSGWESDPDLRSEPQPLVHMPVIPGAF